MRSISPFPADYAYQFFGIEGAAEYNACKKNCDAMADKVGVTAAALPKPMELLGATVAGDEIHAVWESTYQIFDGSSGRWRDGPQPKVGRHALEAFAVDGVLYTVGGCTTAIKASPVVERIAIG